MDMLYDKLRESLGQSDFVITEEMLFPPTMIYLPSPKFLKYMIKKAAKAKKDAKGSYGSIF